MSECIVVCPNDFNDLSFMAFKLKPYMLSGELTRPVVVRGLGDIVLTKVFKAYGLSVKKVTGLPKGYAANTFGFWDGIEPEIKTVLVRNTKAVKCVRVIRIDDEENVTWMRRNANSAEPFRLGQ